MSSELDGILISSASTDFGERLKSFRSRLMLEAGFAGYRSDESLTIVDILHKVAEQGDQALLDFTEKFDAVRLSAEELRISSSALRDAHKRVEVDEPDLMVSIRKAIENVRRYQEKVFIGNRRDFTGGTGIKYTPIRRVGVCVPGASAPLPSTVIMTAVPAQIAGAEEIAVVSPPRYKGSIGPVILAVCHELGLDEVYRIGGAQAVAALACGTATIRKVDKIVGPGNKWVQTAKKMVSGDYVGIDSIAGPSEVLIIANHQANPAWVAADMLSQAEHAADSSAIVLVDSQETAKDILAELERQLDDLSRSKEAAESLKKFSKIIVVKDMAQAVELADELACEHLEVQCGDMSREIAEQISNAGAIFIGSYTPVAVGDYFAGPSHTLPTGGRAKFSSALTSNDFVKSISLIEYDKAMLSGSAADIIRLADIEGLDAHANSVRLRQQQ